MIGNTKTALIVIDCLECEKLRAEKRSLEEENRSLQEENKSLQEKNRYLNCILQKIQGKFYKIP